MNRGEKNGAAKLSQASVRRLKKLKGQMTQEVAAERFGISRSQVSHIWNDKYWKDS